jgi:hypothetical protein
MLCRSTDRGKTWSKARVVVDAPEVDDRNVAVVELPSKDLLVSYNTYTKKRESLAMTVRSADGGKTWGKPAAVGVENTRTRSAALVLRDRTLLLPDGRVVVPTNQVLKPAGRPVLFPGRLVDLALLDDGQTLVVKNIKGLGVAPESDSTPSSSSSRAAPGLPGSSRGSLARRSPDASDPACRDRR